MGATLLGLTDFIPESWQEILLPYENEWKSLLDHLNADPREITPSPSGLFSALQISPDAVRVVILGQDPYPTSGDAHGLSFSVQRDHNLPPTLRNIFKEYETDLQLPRPESGDLSSWADQGVLLLNTILTCAVGEPQSHANYGWQFFTELILQRVAKNDPVAILWGKSAAKYSTLFSPSSVLISSHPSPLSAYRGFLGSRPFTSTNQILERRGEEPVNWALRNV